MTALVWDQVGERRYETGVDHGVLYHPDALGVYDTGFAWNGLTTVSETPTGAEANPQYADNLKYLNLYSAEYFGATIEAFTYPDSFAKCDGSAEPEPGVVVGGQTRLTFGFSYRTRVGNDLEGTDAGYKIHMVWGATASPSQKDYNTINESPEAITFSWGVETLPLQVTGTNPDTGKPYKPTSYMCVDSTKATPANLAALEQLLYGTISTDPALPSPDEVLALFAGSVTTVTPTTPTYSSSTDLITIPSVTGVIYKINGVVKAAGTHPITADAGVNAVPAPGYVFPALAQTYWFIDFS